jgi:hypothetical protein
VLAGQVLRDSWLYPFSSRPEPGTRDEEEPYQNKDSFQQIPVRWPSADAKPEKQDIEEAITTPTSPKKGARQV